MESFSDISSAAAGNGLPADHGGAPAEGGLPGEQATHEDVAAAAGRRQPAGASSEELSRRRDALAQEVARLHWHLGGLAYEMAIRDHFRLDVLVRRAAVLQERDAELAEIERLLRMEQDGGAGSCSNCGAPHSRGAVFCWQCGSTLMQQHTPAALTGEGYAPPQE